MDQNHFFLFKSDLSKVEVPNQLNNPFSSEIPEIAKLAAKEFQDFISAESPHWDYDFANRRGKMFGVLVVIKSDGLIGYLGAVSGVLTSNATSERLVPPILDESKDGHWLTTGMTELSELCKQVDSSSNDSERTVLKQKRKQKSNGLQQRLFENYNFLNLSGEQKNLLEIFIAYSTKTPPAAAGDCAAPKLLQYAFRQNLKPVAIAEFYWGTSAQNTKEHLSFYPACLERCRPILGFMLEDEELW